MSEDGGNAMNEANAMDGEGEKLHVIMAQAADGIAGIRMDGARMLRARRRRRWQEGGVAVGILSVTLAVSMFTLHYGRGSSGPAPVPPGAGPTSPTAQQTLARPTSSPTVVVPVAVEVYDADDGSEGAEFLSAFTQGKGSWLTRQYCQSQPTSHLRPKPGTGLILDLGKQTKLGGIGFNGSWGTVEIWAADSSVTAMPAVVPGQPPAGFHKVAIMTGSDGKFPRFDAATRFLLVWYTQLPKRDRLDAVLDVPPSASNTDLLCHNADGATYEGEITNIVVFQKN